MSTDRAKPTFAELLDFVEGLADDERREAVELLIESEDEQVTQTIEWMQTFLRFGRENPLPTTPPLIRQRLRQSFERHHGRLEATEEQEAELSFDSRTNKILVGVRGHIEDEEDTYQLAYSAPSADILIDVTLTDEQHVRLEGQVLAAPSEAMVWESHAEHPAGRVRSIEGDPLGCFVLDHVPITATRLGLTNGRIEITAALALGTANDGPPGAP